MDAEDRAALVALYRGTGGDAWFKNTGWCTDAPLSEWHGVSVDDQGRVVRVQLSQNNLVGGIPRELGSLHNLQEINLSGNKLTGTVPAELGALEMLEKCMLNRNGLCGEIPKELGFLHNLQELALQKNKLTGGIPRELGSLHNLQRLELWSNNFTDEIPKELGSLHNLHTLNLSENKLTGEIPRELGSLLSFHTLNLSGNELTGEIPRELCSLQNLEKLNLSGNNSQVRVLYNEGAVPAQLVKLYSLWELFLDGNDFSGPQPSLEQLRDIFSTLAGADSSNEDEMKTVRTRVTAMTTAASVPESSVYSGITHRPRRFGHVLEATGEEIVSEVSTRVSGFEGDAMAWSLGVTGIIGCPDFELEVLDLGRNVPALIGQSPSEAEIIDDEFCLLHPVVTCLAWSREIFNPPLLLRFPVGDEDSRRSGPDDGTIDAVEEDYYTSLKTRYSVVKREEGSATWVSISAEVVKMDNGMFVLEAQVAHFTDYALMQKVEVDQGQVEIVPIYKFWHVRRRNVFLFVNRGNETIVIHFWRCQTRHPRISRGEASVGFGPVEVSGAVERDIQENQADEVYSRVVYPTGRKRRPVEIILPNTTSLEVAWATQENRDGHRLVNVWGLNPIEQNTAMVIGPLQDTTAHAIVQDLEVPKGVTVGNKVRAILQSN